MLESILIVLSIVIATVYASWTVYDVIGYYRKHRAFPMRQWLFLAMRVAIFLALVFSLRAIVNR